MRPREKAALVVSGDYETDDPEILEMAREIVAKRARAERIRYTAWIAERDAKRAAWWEESATIRRAKGVAERARAHRGYRASGQAFRVDTPPASGPKPALPDTPWRYR